MESQLPASSGPRFGQRLLTAVLALFCALQLGSMAMAQETTDDPAVVIYDRDIVELEGIIPFGRTYTFGLRSPANVVPGSSVPVSFVVSPVAIPAGVSAVTAGSYVTLSPANPVFTQPNQLITITVTYQIPASATPGPYGMKILATGFAATSGGLINVGTFINASVSAAAVVYTPPAVNILTPVSAPVLGSTITAASLPVTVPFSYTATSTGAFASAITESVASFDLDTLPASAVTLSGIGTSSVTGTGNLTVTTYGIHTFTARATNLGGQAMDVNTFSVVVQALPTVSISSPALGASYSLPYDSASVTVPFTFTGNTPAGSATSIRSLEAILYLNDGAVGTPITLTPGQITGTFGVSIMATATTSLAISAVGTHRLWVKTTNEFGEATNSRTFTVTRTKPKLTFTALNATRAYGASNPPFAFTVGGFVDGDSAAAAYQGDPTISTTATASSSVAGSPYVITIGPDSDLVSAKYDFVFVNAALAVTRAPLVVTAEDKTKVQGTANPALTYTLSGLVNGDTSAVLTTAPVLSTTATAASPVGNYSILNNSVLAAANYEVTFVEGRLTVTGSSATFSIGGTVFFDANVNGARNTDEPGLGGVTVKLYKNNVLVAQTTTTATGAGVGSYSFSNIAPGSYSVDAIELPGLTSSTANLVPVTIVAASVGNVDVGMALNFPAIRTMKANGFTIGYWKNNVEKAIAGKTGGAQVSAANINLYTTTISTLALSPYDGLTKAGAVAIMGKSTSNPVELLSKQLVGSEYNYASGGYIGGNKALTLCFITWGEYIVKNSTSYSSAYIIYAQQWFDAYNNSHGSFVSGPTP